ncbi:helix-turn-helix domain-containing protein [Rhodococcus rhodochrous]|uniref:helix-turn-helix domain-containing protein n=1 Tax=Rhodococcus rhodochrous TaxID=1829 RepID=UPI001E55D106|nr:helix-turn-helix transcriptional regulator [Rhodococcus rhodochrous]MCD2099115.1 helix-turn-helix transcriptional regulator [Rhodococcus rhodochrous]MCD2123599.1 helix-turn-helix transcriptional regulator [Rhodococcus rhodochrous]MCQ4136176.1 helix-turn-helix transcriptional regulator [Rhodococcus rhodochrous]MDJ0020279.1 helix-turn-helix transcriptional regulator [Rhodococcus rhodochrous]
MGIDRTELAAALRRARERVDPGDVGLPSGRRRRTPGLRREEVAMLAGISVDYVVRLEQGRGPVPSVQVLGALARALRLDLDGRNQLFHLAGVSPPGPGTIDMHVRPSVLRLIDRFADLPVVVMSAKGDVLAWNAMASALHGDWSAVAPDRRNIHRLRFLPDDADPPLSSVGVTEAEFAATAHQSVASLRSAAARYPRDTGLHELIDELRSGSEHFAELWATAEPGGWRTHTKTVNHPALGPIVLDCDTLHVPDVDQSVIVYSAAPGTPAAESLALLRVVGTQQWGAESSRP